MTNNIQNMLINGSHIKKAYLDNTLIYTDGTNEYDYYISTEGSNNNSGRTLDDAFADLTPISEKAKNGDTVFIEEGDYFIPSRITISKGITLHGAKNESPIIFTIASGVDWGLVFDIQNELQKTINIENIEFVSEDSNNDASAVQVNLGSQTKGNFLNVDNCAFADFKKRGEGGALKINSNSSNNKAQITNSCFLNNQATGFAISGACLYMTGGGYGQLRVYDCIFNNPMGGRFDEMHFCGQTGRAISTYDGYLTSYFNAKGSCNEFLGAGDSCFHGYTEEECP